LEARRHLAQQIKRSRVRSFQYARIGHGASSDAPFFV
jgi:hypothetical protein